MDNKPAYFIFDVKINDLAGMKVYGEKVATTYQRYGGKRVAFGGQVVAVEGQVPNGHLVMLQFDCMAQAQAWHDSPEYQEILPYRLACCDSTVWLVEGVAATHI